MSLNHINRHPIKAKHCITVDMKQQSFIPKVEFCNLILVYDETRCKSRKKNVSTIYTYEMFTNSKYKYSDDWTHVSSFIHEHTQ